MNHYPIVITANSDIGALNGDGQRALGVGIDIVSGLILGKGKFLPIVIGEASDTWLPT